MPEAHLPTQTMALGAAGARVSARLEAWRATGTIGAVWRKDHSVWVDDPAPEITDRLGWLDLPTTMRPHLAVIGEFAERVRAEGFRHVVVLGMGGSSLAPEVYARTFAPRDGWPQLVVLDSTHPAAVASVRTAIDPRSTLFVVSSKSGTTIEPVSFFRLFWSVVAAGADHPGDHFAAITDPGSPLADLAGERGFRAVFEAPPDVGGRYSALTHFGLVPAALAGIDIERLLAGAASIAEASQPGADPGEVPGVALGAALGELALEGRDKATFVVSAGLAAFPDWIEQLIAESTGKDGTGIVPVAGEQLASPDRYASDRVFIQIALTSDDTRGEDRALADLEAAGHPVVRIGVADRYGLGAEMYRAEWATAMAGSVLGIHPFDQPDVQRAKELAAAAMAGTGPDGTIPEIDASDPTALADALRPLLDSASPGDYVAFQAFIEPTRAVGAALDRARIAVRDRRRLATTVGFGPRFLHSTGQLHKGGANAGIFIQVVDHPQVDLPVPETDFTFRRLIGGQADGDYLALQDAGRRVIRVCLGGDASGGLGVLSEVLHG